MESKELMLGNWVKYAHNSFWIEEIQGQPVQIDIDNYQEIYFDEGGTLEPKYEPIPLTPEILEMAGFVKNDGALGAALGHTLILESREGTYKNIAVVYNSDKNYPQYYVFMREGSTTDIGDNNIVTISRDLQYLHQLQNLFFALTGTHLKIELK